MQCNYFILSILNEVLNGKSPEGLVPADEWTQEFLLASGEGVGIKFDPWLCHAHCLECLLLTMSVAMYPGVLL